MADIIILYIWHNTISNDYNKLPYLLLIYPIFIKELKFVLVFFFLFNGYCILHNSMTRKLNNFFSLANMFMNFFVEHFCFTYLLTFIMILWVLFSF